MEKHTYKIDHIGIAVKDLKETMKLYEDLGLNVKTTETVEEQMVNIAFIPCGEANLELLESTDPDGPIAKFIEKRGEGIHHISIRVTNLEALLNKLKEKGIKLIDEAPRKGAHTSKIAFIHPKAMRGVLLELC
ncbi:MAG: methylmalonyl-CoA epimerase, partial [Promethearchaeota archaeon]